MVFFHALNQAKLADMAALIEGMRNAKLTFPKRIEHAWEEYSKPVMTHTLDKLPAKKNPKAPPCYKIGVCICGDNDVWASLILELAKLR